MSKFEGIIYKAFDNYVMLRGFAPIAALARTSKKSESYQRSTDETHKKDIITFLDSGEYVYFPDVILGCSVNDYAGFLGLIDSGDTPSDNDYKVPGLSIRRKLLSSDMRRATLTVDDGEKRFTRIDGNHRLEPFDEDVQKWAEMLGKRDYTAKDVLEYKKRIGNTIIPYTIIFVNSEVADAFEAGIFHNINFTHLPLREEASLRIIAETEAFRDKEKLGKQYSLALKLIKEVKNGRFKNIPWLDTHRNNEDSYFRITCLRIVELLLNQCSVIEKDELPNCKRALDDNLREIEQKERRIRFLGEDIEDIKRDIDRAEQNNSRGVPSYLERKLRDSLILLQNERNGLSNELSYAQQQKQHIKHRYDKLNHYIKEAKNIGGIVESINSLLIIYQEIGENYGNISFLCVLVYYSILDKGQLHTFVDWAVRNGINKITAPDDVSKDAAQNLISLFERISQTKKNEIFISMQFGDSQSELIYEKIVRAIDQFNMKHSSIHLKATPIRVDRTVESSTFSIQDKILEAIQSCGLIIADLSSANVNVYHEIGYAMGIAESHDMIPNIILLYKEDTDHNKEGKDVDKFVGFNLRNLSQLRFTNYDQLVNGLMARLEKHYGL